MLEVIKKKIRHHSLTGRITPAVMHKAFKAVKRNRGAAGIDKQSIKLFESNLSDNLTSLMAELKSGEYEPFPSGCGFPKVRASSAPSGFLRFGVGSHRRSSDL